MFNTFINIFVDEITELWVEFDLLNIIAKRGEERATNKVKFYLQNGMNLILYHYLNYKIFNESVLFVIPSHY